MLDSNRCYRKKKRQSQGRWIEHAGSRSRKQVAGLSRVASMGLYEKVSFVQRLKRSEEVIQVDILRERVLGQGDSQWKGLETEECSECKEQQGGQCSWRGGSEMKSSRRGGPGHEALVDHRKGFGFYSEEDGSHRRVLSRGGSDVIAALARLLWLLCLE